MTKQTWNIRIEGYGTFEFEGTEQEAEEMRSHKAQWEGGVGMKWRKDLSTPLDVVQSEIAAAFDSGNGCDMSLIMKRAELLKAS